MAARPRAVFTENFAGNLDSIRIFLGDAGEAAFRHLLDRIFNDVVETVRRFPLIGRSFLAHEVRSLEAQVWVGRLKERLDSNDVVREYVVDDYIILYLVKGDRLVFLAIKHHRQLSFDLRGL